jgi:hypothetical protein
MHRRWKIGFQAVTAVLSGVLGHIHVKKKSLTLRKMRLTHLRRRQVAANTERF